MDMAAHSTPRSPGSSADVVRSVAASQALTVSAMYQLSEAGRKASLLMGGDGRALQQLSVQVPATRLHLVAVDRDGVARLRLQPRFERTDDERVVRHDAPPTYDAPPTVEDLFRDAARNHELERVHQRQRTAPQDRRREAEQERRTHLAHEFLADASQRAMLHPRPTPMRCFLGTPGGRLAFDTKTDVGTARELPAEAYRRFQADLRDRSTRNLAVRGEQVALHDARRRMVEEWIARAATAEQQARHAAGLLPLDEVIEALTDDAFAALKDQPRYALDGLVRLQTHLRAATGRADLLIAPTELHITVAPATSATAAQWAVVRHLQTVLPDATVTLREHRLSWRREPALPALTVRGALASRQLGPFVFRRKFAVPER
ncbi:MAG: hypothetical protein ABIX28_01970 [Vicinamibacterales bacterium]